MDADRRTALSAGVLFIIATAASVSATTLLQPVLNRSDYLTRISTHGSLVAGGALLEFLAAGASAGVAISLYPVLKNWNVGLALGSVVFRTIEAVMYIASLVSLLSLSLLTQQLTGAGSAERAAFHTIGDSFLHVRQEAGLVGVLAFSVGALMYYYLFYRSRLVPRWLSGWGIAGIILMIVACLLAWFSHRSVSDYTILALPIGVQEMVLAVWLIARGFSLPALQSMASSRVGTAAIG
jgi:hypothetical protein